MIDERIVKYQQGELNTEEVGQLLSDAEQDAELKTALTGLLNVSALATLHSSFTDREEGEAQLPSLKVQLRRRMLYRLGRPLLKYAAMGVLIIAVTLAIGYYQTKGPGAIAMQSLTVPHGQHCQITLSDGSKVWVNGGSTLRYPSYFEGERRIELTGEALFDVTKDGNLPFVVSAKGVCVKVIGTRFNVRGYAAEPLTVSLLHGMVSVYRENDEQRGIILYPNEQLTVRGDQMTKSRMDADVAAWKDGLLVFKSATMADIIANLQTCFNVKIMVKDPSLLKTRYSGKFRKSDGVVNILDVISRVQYFKVVQKRESNEIELHPNID
ncbi:FecR family protein [Hoylesella loescheii]|uniref:Sigma factor regulatory protein, FecR/PupR family n=1 Tax=Hoylesella loescheii DSM 19665 = JCM 12249 = ATCC 15930 TaxID=1122985 RepID=A0A069QDQ5_HOYLO|nr:FecR domain-containing protein [Hoylesella loescheii]KDR50925.1 sigma factor regulatory protein, FecR/PupR family [Hoylesella loescheii DSM 19665 = JCM 12249 = ATCC 15930]